MSHNLLLLFLLFFFFFFLSINDLFFVAAMWIIPPKGVRLNMIHQHDVLLQRRQALDSPDAVEMNLFSGSYSGTGQYFVDFEVGTPPQKLVLIPDTGSSITWMRCHHHKHGHGRGGKHGSGRKRGRGYGHVHDHDHDDRPRSLSSRVPSEDGFHAYESSTFKPIPCMSKTCKEMEQAKADCSTAMSLCSYEASYQDNTAVDGFFAYETVKVELSNGEKISIENVTIGCTNTVKGEGFEEADGILGLGLYRPSFASKAMDTFGAKFAYCLVDRFKPRSTSSFVVFGDHQYPELPNMQYTPLTLISEYYLLNVTHITIDDEILEIDKSVWDVNSGGTIVDSGMTLTQFSPPAYDVVMNTFKSKLMKHVTPVRNNIFEFCFKGKGFDEKLVPKLTFHFANSAQFQPHVKNYVIPEVDDQRCLGFVKGSPQEGFTGPNIIGNYMQQNFLWELNLMDDRLGFAPSTCA